MGIAPEFDLVLPDNRPDFPVMRCHLAICNGWFRRSGGMRVIEAEDLRAALTFTSVRGDKRDRIDFEMGARGCMNVGRWLDLDDPAPFSEQETAAF